MLMLPPSVKIHVATSPVDMRKSFDGLAGVVSSVLDRDPLSGHLFVFFNRPGNLVKVLWWSNGGLCLFAKRLERGRFRWARPVEAGAQHVEIPRRRSGAAPRGRGPAQDASAAVVESHRAARGVNTRA